MTPLSSDEPLWNGDDHVVTLVAVDVADADRLPAALAASNGMAEPTDVTCGQRSARCCTPSSPSPGRPRARCSPNSKGSGSNLPFESQWYSDNELARHRAMLSTFAQWRAQTRGELTEIGTEIDVDGVLSQRGAGARPPRPARTRQRGPAGGRRHQDRQDPGQQGRRAAPRPAGDVSAGRRRRPTAAGRYARRRHGWSIWASRERAAPPNASRTR